MHPPSSLILTVQPGEWFEPDFFSTQVNYAKRKMKCFFCLLLAAIPYSVTLQIAPNPYYRYHKCAVSSEK